MGYTKHDLVLSWGAPTRTDDDGDGGQILIYAYMGQNGGLLTPNGTYTDVNTWYDYRIFYVNADRKIYAWRTSREAVPPQQVNVNIYRH